MRLLEPAFAMPKSMMRSEPSLQSITFCGFRSRWMTSCSCMYSSASHSRPYLVMEYLQGQTLDEVMQVTRPLPEKDALQIASRLCDALEYMHEHDVIHRDLKPQNVMLCNDGSLRIMDFGIAKAGSSKRITFGGFSPTLGTPDYMAPEQVKGQRGDERTDIYSLGAILYEMLTGRLPFEG